MIGAVLVGTIAHSALTLIVLEMDMVASGPVCISVINMKGGVGKTTIAVLLARHAARSRNLKVLAIDLDPQANLSQALMGDFNYRRFIEEKHPSVVEVFEGYVPPTAGRLSPSQLDIDHAVHALHTNLDIIPSRFDFSDHLVKSIGTDSRVLARLIANNTNSF